MLQWKRNKAAFTLIELLVVVIIVAVLAAVGVPLLSANVQRARTSEAEAGLGTIRTAMRSYFVENGSSYLGATFLRIGLNVTPGVATGGDLDGRFFEDSDYSLTGLALAQATFCASATGGSAVAPRGTQVTGIVRSINERGDLFNSANCGAATILN